MAGSASHIARTIPASLAALVPKEMAEPLVRKPRNLYETLSRLPRDGLGLRVYQTRWTSKGIGGCFWEVSRVELKKEGTHGKAWGRLVWRGKPVSEKDERIPGSLKYCWLDGVSEGHKLPPVSAEPAAKQETNSKQKQKSSLR